MKKDENISFHIKRGTKMWSKRDQNTATRSDLLQRSVELLYWFL